MAIGLDALSDIRVAVTAFLGRSTASIGDVLKFTPGTVVQLDTKVDEPVPVLVNGVPVATGDLIALDDGALAIHINEISNPESLPR